MFSKIDLLMLLGRTIYREPEPEPRIRNSSKPMQVICVGFPRSGTESLQVALLKLGYDYTYHGWDILFEQPHRMQAWSRLAMKKWYGSGEGESNITRADFDALLGHAVAVSDAPANVFAHEMIEAYPEAKVILNCRNDFDAWHRSAIKNLCETANESWMAWSYSWLTANGFWSWMIYERLLWPLLFRATDDGEGALSRAVRRNGKWVYREHCSMIRGLVPQSNLLEWDPNEGWEPLCKFLGKHVPIEPFPLLNGPEAFAGRIEHWYAENQRKVRRNVSIIGAAAVASVAVFAWRFAPTQVETALKIVQRTVSTSRA